MKCGWQCQSVYTITFFILKAMQLCVFVDSARLGSARLEHFRGRLGSARIFSIFTRLGSARTFWTAARLGSARTFWTAARLGSNFQTPRLVRAEPRLEFRLGSSLSLIRTKQIQIRTKRNPAVWLDVGNYSWPIELAEHKCKGQSKLNYARKLQSPNALFDPMAVYVRTIRCCCCI